MERIAFTLRLPAENIAEYTRRHDEIWDELKLAIHAQGGRNYSIFAAPELNLVFGYLEVDDSAAWAQGGSSDITLRWWKFMSDIMPTNADFSPIQTDLQRVFTLE
ncbi:MAG TPA: L-rhamnose mutarotase [Galbitalea sp.]